MKLQNLPEQYKSVIFGNENLGINDKSQLDAKLITYLIAKGFEDHEIESIFNTYPTTGKYLERKSNDPKGASLYLSYTISKMREYINSSNYSSGTSWTPGTSSEALVKIDQQSIIEMEEYGYSSEGMDIGFYAIKISSTGVFYQKISNFLIKLDKEIKMKKDNQPKCYFDGEFIFQNKTFNFKKMESDVFSKASLFTEFIYSICGTSAKIKGTPKQLVDATIEYNPNPQTQEAKYFGYNDTLTQYITPSMIITKDQIIEEETPMKEYVLLKDNNLDFKIKEPEEIIPIKNEIIDSFLTWDEYRVTIFGLAFTFLPLIYPFLKNTIHKKPYIMFRGTSGSGKTTFIENLQRFYGNFSKLVNWSSTGTSIELMGNTFKDALFAVDDLKVANFPKETDKRKAMQLIQSYYDEVGRQRAMQNLDLRDEKYIKGFLALSAEDFVFTEASSLARGIIIDVQSKENNFNLVGDLYRLSKEFKSITPHLIKYILRNYNVETISKMFDDLRDESNETIQQLDEEITLDNLARVINNFVMIKLSWKIISEFLCQERKDKETKLAELNKFFKDSFYTVLSENLQRIQGYKYEVKFIETFWEMVERKKIKLADVNSLYLEEDAIGYYNVENGNVQIGFNLNDAIREVNKYLITEGGLATSSKNLKEILIKKGFIEELPGKRYQIKHIRRRGVYYIGDIPKYLFGIEDQESTMDNVANNEPESALFEEESEDTKSISCRIVQTSKSDEEIISEITDCYNAFLANQQNLN